jgi:hypothetical protein
VEQDLFGSGGPGGNGRLERFRSGGEPLGVVLYLDRAAFVQDQSERGGRKRVILARKRVWARAWGVLVGVVHNGGEGRGAEEHIGYCGLHV